MKTFQGQVVSVKTPKTAVVEVISHLTHSLYKKIIARPKRFKAHFEQDLTVAEGDKVIIAETRPLSKTKHFRVVKIIK